MDCIKYPAVSLLDSLPNVFSLPSSDMGCRLGRRRSEKGDGMAVCRAYQYCTESMHQVCCQCKGLNCRLCTQEVNIWYIDKETGRNMLI